MAKTPPTQPFFALEGIDGSGKTTQLQHLEAHLINLGYKVHSTCEPTKNTIGKMIRDIFAGKIIADQHVIAALFCADRLDHIYNETDGLLEQLKTHAIISDRYYLSSLAYHGAHVDMQWVFESNRPAMNVLRPTAHIYIEMDPKVSMERIAISRQETELYENLENLIAVRDAYEKGISLLPHEETVIRINGNQSEEDVKRDIIKAVDNILDKNH
ncbi:MAG: dTMP kinase [Cryomorphaceae bacterium]|nr:dTMP kinase [Cryomorphaceae bacterium]